MDKKEKKDYWLLGTLILIFVALLLIFGERHDFPDSLTYSEMSPDVSFGYPLFLWIFRSIFGKVNYYFFAALFQNLFAAYCIYNITRYIKKYFKLHIALEILIACIFLTPYLATGLLTASGMIVTNSILTEGLTISGYLLILRFLFETVLEQSGKSLWKAWGVALVLVLIRPQMIIPSIAVLIVGIIFIFHKRKYRNTICFIVAILIFAVVNLGGNTLYRSFFTNEQKENSLNTLTILTNILYASRTEDEDSMPEDKAELYILLQDKLQEEKLTSDYSPEGFLNRARHIEDTHDTIKLVITYPTMYGYFYEQGYRGEADITAKIVEYAGYYEKTLLVKNWKTWLYDYLACSSKGLIRTNSIDGSIFTYVSILFYLLWIIITVIISKKYRNCALIRINKLVSGMILLNAFGVATTIMCLSRYMIYNMSIFYVVLLLNIIYFASQNSVGKNHSSL